MCETHVKYALKLVRDMFKVSNKAKTDQSNVSDIE